MGPRAIVFDFDGTLVLSNQIKRDAYYALFPQDELHHKIIDTVLEKMFEESRYTILREILRLTDRAREAEDVEKSVQKLASQYRSVVVAGATNCAERQGAQSVLEALHGTYALYLSSTTPENDLRQIVESRNWTSFFSDIFGYPRKKIDSLIEVMARVRIGPDQVLVVGDGESDRNSALETGCNFFHLATDTPLTDVLRKVAEIDA